MARLLGTLRSSQPVARFQRSCGLFPAAEEGGGSGDPAEGPRERGICNGAGALRCPAAAVRGAPGGARSGRGPQLQVFAERCTCVSLLVTLGGSVLIYSFLRLGSFKVHIIRTVGFYGVVTLTLLCLYCHNCLKGSQVLLLLRTGAMFTNCLMMFSDCMALAHAVGEEDNNQDNSQVVVTETEKGCTQKYIVKNYFYYYLFKFSAALGEEIFYITFLPFTYWNIDHSVSRRMIIVWSIVMYIGQVSKDILKWPRPLSPPVVKLEMRTNAEYGMPSTHAMAATAISFSFFIATTNQYKYPFELGLVAAFVFSTLVCLSRLYTGMHTVLDVIGGALISAVLLVLLYPAWDTIDHLLLTSPFCPLFSIVVPLVLCYNYPKLDYYSPTRGDTTTILGAAAGATVGFWLNNQYAAPAYTSKTFQPGFPLITSAMVFVLARFLVGISVVLLTRWVMKSAVLGALGYRYQFPIRDLEARRRLEVEVPYKFVTYSSVGFTATVIVPLLHELLGLM